MSRAELLLASGCSYTPALEAASAAIDAVVAAWARLEAEEAEKKRKDAEILKYKMQEHSVSPGSRCLDFFRSCALLVGNPSPLACYGCHALLVPKKGTPLIFSASRGAVPIVLNYHCCARRNDGGILHWVDIFFFFFQKMLQLSLLKNNFDK